MKTKYVCRSHISLYVNFHNNRTMWSTNLHVKFCRWGEKEKERRSVQINSTGVIFTVPVLGPTTSAGALVSSK